MKGVGGLGDLEVGRTLIEREGGVGCGKGEEKKVELGIRSPSTIKVIKSRQNDIANINKKTK